MTVVGPASETLPDYDIATTLRAEGMAVFSADGEDIDDAYLAIVQAIQHNGPAAAILHRPICPGIEDLQGKSLFVH